MSGVTDDPEVISTRFSFTTNAVVNTVNNDVLLAAPGAGLRYRIYAASVHYGLSNAAANNWIGRLTNGGGSELFGTGLVQGSTTANNQTWPNGIPWGANTAVNCAHLCTAVTVAIQVLLQYVIETV